MDTVTKKLQGGFLCCALCEKLYKRPCSLRCGHAICRGCLAEYKKLQQNAKCFECPKCKRMTDVKDSESHLQLDTSNILKEETATNSTAVEVDAIDIRLESDKKEPRSADVTVVDVEGIETLVITDHWNKSIKAFYTVDQHRRHSSLNLKSYPWSIARLCNNQLAVTFLSFNRIEIVEVTPDLVRLSSIKTEKKYHCLTALHNSTLVAGAHHPLALDIIDMSGSVLRSLLPGLFMVVQYPSFLRTTEDGNILMTDFHACSACCLTPEREVIFNYSTWNDGTLKKPQGITTTATGDILVADGNYNITQLTRAGHFVRILLTSEDGIIVPYGICYHKDKLYVAVEGPHVKMFSLST